MTLPSLPPGKGVVLSGKLPLWLWTALVQTYRHAPWIGVFQSPLGNRAVVAASRDEKVMTGSLIASEVEHEAHCNNQPVESRHRRAILVHCSLPGRHPRPGLTQSREAFLLPTRIEGVLPAEVPHLPVLARASGPGRCGTGGRRRGAGSPDEMPFIY